MEAIFNDSNSPTRKSAEECLSAILWEWRFADREDRNEILVKRGLALQLEFWMPFELIDSAKQDGLWCDGIALMTVSDINRTAIRVSGVGYFPHSLAPFEIEFHWAKRRDLQTTKIVLRVGFAPASRVRGLSRIQTDPAELLSHRPTDDQDWAIAVELTPDV